MQNNLFTDICCVWHATPALHDGYIRHEASCENLHSGEPGSLRATILARLEGKSGQVAWDAKRPPSEAAAKLRKKQKKSKVPEPGIECQLYVKGI